MYIIIVGGGKVGRGVARDLISPNREVCIVERDANTAWEINNELGEVALTGDATEVHVQRAAGMNRADVVVACTGRDQANLAVAQTAQTRFNVGKVIARINDPRNERIFRALGFSFIISTTRAIVSAIEQEVATGSGQTTQRSTDFTLCELTISPLAPAVGSRVKDLELPPDAVLAVIIRDGEQLADLGPTTTIDADDVVVAVIRPQQEAALRCALCGTS